MPWNEDDTSRPPERVFTASVVALWAAVVIVAVGAVAAAVIVRDELRETTPWAQDVPLEGANALAGGDEAHSALRIAGSGSNLPLTHELVEAFLRRRPDVQVIVFESIGTTGGITAVSDGVIDLGLASRPLRPKEEALGLVVIPYAQVAVTVAVNLGVADDGITHRELVDLYAGRRRSWSDGSPAVVLLRERGDSSHLVFEERWDDFKAAVDDAHRAGRWRVLFEDRALHEALVSTPGGVGLFDLGSTRAQGLALKALAVDGYPPTEENIRAGRYPFVKELSFVSAEQPTGLAAEFLEFVRSSDGQTILRERGYLPP
ncbi:MAG: substrate-binding domain-containing protein [Nannocystaceae bacterium]